MSNQTVTELKLITAKSATNNGFDVTDFKMFTHVNPLSIQVNIRHKTPNKKVTIDDCSILSEYIDEAIQKSVALTRQYAKRQSTWFKNRFNEDLKIDSVNSLETITEELTIFSSLNTH
mgnify:CR=1 FL=1